MVEGEMAAAKRRSNFHGMRVNTLRERAEEHMRKLEEREEVLQACMGGDTERSAM